MKTRIAGLIFLLATAVDAGALAVNLAAAVQKLQSASLADRMQAFYQLTGGPEVRAGRVPDRERLAAAWGHNAEAAKTALVRALAVENETAKKPFDDRFSTYYGDLIAVIAALRDERALPALLGALTTGALAQDGVAEIGLPALGPLLDRLHAGSHRERQAAVRTLGRLYEKVGNGPATAERRNEIRMAILAAARDANPLVRWAAADALGNIKGADDVVSVLTNLSEHDDYWYLGLDGQRVYPVRLAAKRALRQR
jgi:HEAT repeat protein